MRRTRSKLSLLERTRPRLRVATRDRRAEDERLVYFGSVILAVFALALAASAGLAR
jgi:hypothetical protein